MNIDIYLEQLDEQRLIEDSKKFPRMSLITQVEVPKNSKNEVLSNRLTHSYEVGTTALTMAASIAKKMNVPLHVIDHQHSIYNACLLHDMGLCVFAHQGQKAINKYFKKAGLEMGFCDNNNTLVVIKHHNIKVRDYTLASTIKYPHRLYDYQNDEYLPILARAIALDKAVFIKNKLTPPTNAKRTIAASIMDESDRIAYTFRDMGDFLCNGGNLPVDDIYTMAERANFDDSTSQLLDEFLHIAAHGTKTDIKAFLSDLKHDLSLCYELGDNGEVQCTDPQKIYFREFLKKLTHIYYINPLRKQKFHTDNMLKLNLFIKDVVENGLITSKKYKNIIEQSKGIDKLIAQRDMLSEVTDWYVIDTYKL